MGQTIAMCVTGLGMYVAGGGFATHHPRIGVAGLIVTAIGALLMKWFERLDRD